MMRAAVFFFSRQGGKTARRIAAFLRAEYDCRLFSPEKYAGDGVEPISCGIAAFTGTLMGEMAALVYVGACGVAVRAIAPHIKSKATDPAVICVDELGKFAVALLSGHIGGGNRLTDAIASGIGAISVITTATDVNGRFSVDTWATEQGYVIGSLDIAKAVSAAILEKDLPIYADVPIKGSLPSGLYTGDEGELGIAVSVQTLSPFDKTLALIPKVLTLGIGCRRGVPMENIETVVLDVLARHELDIRAVKDVASIDLKADEEGLLDFCRKYGLNARFYSAEELLKVRGIFSASPLVQRVTGVENVCERSAAMGSGKIIVHKTAINGVTVAVAEAEWEVNFG